MLFHILRAKGYFEYAKTIIIFASLTFYSLGSSASLPILIISILFNYLMGLQISSFKKNSKYEDADKKLKATFVFALSMNLILLSYYKYFSFLPLGISFFTIMQIMYIVDCFQGLIKPNNLKNHLLAVSFFPSVVMGPILKIKNISMQFDDLDSHQLDYGKIASGIFLFSIGLFKKVVIADSFARVADSIYSADYKVSMLEAWVGSISFSMQLYFDFSGYSDMAFAIAIMLGITIPINFNSPYQAKSLTEFWRKWHISLSNFITTYLYTPIVRSFKKISFNKMLFATFISMLIAGIWHGSKYTFVIFGAMHGIGLVINQIRKKSKRKLPSFLAILVTFIYVNISFIFFRANTVEQALSIIYSLVTPSFALSANNITSTIRSSELIEIGLPILIGLVVVLAKSNSNFYFKNFKPTPIYGLYFILLSLISFLYMNSNMASGFLYVDF